MNITPVLLEFNHHVDADKVVFLRVKKDDRTLIKQIEDEINKQVKDIVRATETKWKNKADRLSNLIECLESYTNDWDDLCDCNTKVGIHSEHCITAKIRKDVQRAYEGER